MNNSNTQTATKSISRMTWMVDYSGEMVNENRTGTRSSDGRFLVRNGKLSAATFTQSATNMALAEDFGCDADCLFIGKRN